THRLLHPLPTRRSSDLGTSSNIVCPVLKDWVICFILLLFLNISKLETLKYQKHLFDLLHISLRTIAAQYLYLIDTFVHQYFGGIDRKSTRLNSSHVKIS